MKQQVLITAHSLGGGRDSHGIWLYYLLRTQLQVTIDKAEIIYRDFKDADLNSVDLVIGFELSREAKEKLNSMGKVYLNLRIHPVRFMDDIFFSFETNSDSIRLSLQNYCVNDELCKLQASIIKATVIKLNKKNIIMPNSLLLVGQTEHDLVLYDGNKYLSLLDRIDQIKEVASNYNNIYFKPHPYVKNNHYLLRELRKTLGKVQYIHTNVYQLLANEGTQHVAALNSSVLYESVYFDKQTTFLLHATFTNTQIGIYGDYFNGAFWTDILSSTLQTVPSSLELTFQPSRTRRALNDFWGYNEISDEIIYYSIFKNRVKNFLNRLR